MCLAAFVSLLCLTFVPNSPNPIPAVIRDEHGAIGSNGHSNRSSPLAVLVGVYNEAGEKVFNHSGLPVLEGNKDDLRAIRRRAVPGSMQRDEQPIAVTLRELVARVERNT